MSSLPSSLWGVEERLGELAMQFRGARDNVGRRTIAAEYARLVEQLVQCGNWSEMPAPEDQLPDRWMPESFFHFWGRRQDAP